MPIISYLYSCIYALELKVYFHFKQIYGTNVNYIEHINSCFNY